MHVLAIPGSLRTASYTTALLREAIAQLPPQWTSTFWTRNAEIPHFSEDLEANPAPVVVDFREALRQAHLVLISTPEYNGSVPGTLKNAMDWASRPFDTNPLRGKIAAVMSASPSPSGGASARTHLLHVLARSGATALQEPVVAISSAWQEFDAQGQLTKPETRRTVAAAVLTITDELEHQPTR